MEISLEIILYVSFFIFGTLIGSFLNVVIFRYNTSKDLKGRSKCQSCGATLGPFSLIPIFSFLIQKGSCRVCKSRISIQYPIIEFITGVLFLCVFYTQTSILEIILGFVVVSILIVIMVYDFRHGIIPNIFVYTFAGLSFFSLFFNINTFSYITPDTNSFLAGPILAFPVWFLWYFSKGAWIGLGDAKLFLGIGWFLGLSAGVTAFILSFWIGAVVSLFLIFLSRLMRIKKLNLIAKDLTIKTEIPFAPFIILGFFIVYFFEFNLISIIAP